MKRRRLTPSLSLLALCLALCLAPLLPLIGAGHLAQAADGKVQLTRAHTNPFDLESLQRGARLFINYCTGCHSARYQRYSRVAEDLHIPEKLTKENLIFTDDKFMDPIETSLDKQQALAWFGVVPPDLSLIARARGVDWLYTFLTSFYVDPKRPTGYNNQVFKDVAMPHVLWELEGLKEWRGEDPGAKKGKEGVGFAPLTEGTMTELQYREAVRDLVNFLDYMSEPAKLKRYRIGVGVLLYLGLLLFVVYLLKKEYWKDVH
jgi:ubiquinol-cytochrome c reductase cytochrome c1 subunit